jgi:hypothetical protein
MNCADSTKTVRLNMTKAVCPIGEITGKKKLIQFDALSHYNRYTDSFDYEDVPERISCFPIT